MFVVKVAVEHADLVLVHQQLLDSCILRASFDSKPVIAVCKIHILIWNTDYLLVCFSPVAGLILDLYLYDLGSVLLELG